MSVVGLRSYEYRWATQLDDKLHRLVDQLEQDLPESGHDMPQARLMLALNLDKLAELLDPLAENAQIDAVEALRVPAPILRRLRAAEVDGRDFGSGLQETISHLRDQERPLDDDDRALLRYLLDATSDEALGAFDRIVRR